MSKPLTDHELDQLYRDFLDECYGNVTIAGLEYATSRALLECDPTAYRCGFADWLDAELADGRLFESAGQYYSEEQES